MRKPFAHLIQPAMHYGAAVIRAHQAVINALQLSEDLTKGPLNTRF